MTEILHTLGFHQHHGEWRRKRINEITQSSSDAALVAAHAIYTKANPSPQELAEFRRLLNEQTIVARLLGDTGVLARQNLAVLPGNSCARGSGSGAPDLAYE